MTATLSKRTRMTIAVILTLIAGCAWESSWFGKRSIASLQITPETRR